MSKYDVYGIGNALVDIEYAVSPEQLLSLGIEKGVMTLVEAERQRQVMAALDGQYRHRSCGGSAANSLIAVTQFGGGAFYTCKVADDDIGTFYCEDLMNHGVDTNVTAENRERGVTGTCLVFVTPDADRTMNTHLGITAELSAGELNEQAIGASRFLYIEGYLASSDTARRAVGEARRVATAAGVASALTLSDPNMVELFRTGLLEMIGDGVELLFANEVEACKLAGVTHLPDAFAHLRSLAARFVVTRGARGAVVFDGERCIDIDGVAVNAVDTVGAGDMFAGAFLYGLCRGLTFERAGALAVAASAELVTSYGPRMETRAVLAIRDRLAA